jgi:uncharacterized protein
MGRNEFALPPMKLTKFSAQNSGSPEVDFPKPERLLIGNPKRETSNAIKAETSATTLYSGIWRCEPGKWRIEFGETEHEVFTVLEGRCRVYDDEGNFQEIATGESIHIPPNFTGAFEVLETVTKSYVIVE